MSDDKLPPSPVYTSPHANPDAREPCEDLATCGRRGFCRACRGEPPREALLDSLSEAARAVGEGRDAGAQARLAVARKALEDAWREEVDGLRHDFATASLAEQRLRLYLEPLTLELAATRAARAKNLPAVVAGGELAATVCEARATVAEGEGRMEEAALARDLAKAIRMVAYPTWPPGDAEIDRLREQASRRRAALARTAANNHLARHPDASASNWEQCEQPSCRDAQTALLVGAGEATATPGTLADGLATAITICIEAYGELIWEPGMSDVESATRDRDVSWRHGGEADAVKVAEMHVAAGRWTAERAAEHLRGLREQAARDRVRVEEYERQRAKGSRGTRGSQTR